MDLSPAIVRVWRGRAATRNAQVYLDHLATRVLPSLRAIDGFLGATVLRREARDETEFLVMTRWSGMPSIRSFAGPDPEAAVIEPEARAVLTAFDSRVEHFALEYDTDVASGR